MKNLFKYFLISFGIHSFIIVCVFLFEKEFSKSKTDILEVEILSNKRKINNVLKKTEENEIGYKTSIKHSPLTNCKTSIFLSIITLLKMSYSHQIIIGRISQGDMEAYNVIL